MIEPIERADDPRIAPYARVGDHEWLREHIYRHGRKHAPEELIERATGGPMSIVPYLAYLRAKYGEIYQLPSM